MSEQNSHIYRFGSFRLDPAKRVLTCNGQLIPIPPKPFESLLVLVQRHGQLVHKDELIKLIWADAFVEEANISQNVFLLRRLLAKHGKGSRYIETVPRRGYRFIAKVREEGKRRSQGNTRPRLDQFDVKGDATDSRNGFITSLAILPLENVGGDPELEYLSDGITESMINTLSQVRQLRVMARTSVFRYKGRKMSLQDVARELNVNTVVTGRIITRNDTVNVQIELTRVSDESQFWGKQYDLKIGEIDKSRGEIAQELLEQLRLKLEWAGEDNGGPLRRHTNNGAAYQLYLKGLYYHNKLTEEGLKKGVEYFQQAIDEDPTFALAYTGLADCYALGGLPLDPDSALAYAELVDCYALVTLAPKEAMSKAKAAALMALEIDNNLAEAHASMGFIRYRLDWDWRLAEQEYRRAIELSRNCPKVHYWLSMCLRTMGRLDEALAEAKLAYEIDPFMHIIKVELGRIYYFARYYDQAIEYYSQVLELEPSFLPAHFRLGQAYTQKGMYSEAIVEFQRAIPLIGDDPEAVAALAYVYALSGQKDKAREVLEKLRALSLRRYVSSYDLAIIYLGLDDKDKALEWLQNAYADRSVWLIGIKVEPMLDSLRPDPRFATLMRRIGFEP
jgi:DNA-binding winged helix-turn-helix (wHTH) protein/tetratricopeptide (TPR) repeat protein